MLWDVATAATPAAPPVAQRAMWAQAAVDAHGDLSGLGPYETVSADNVVHLLTDLMHLVAEHGEDFTSVLRAAQRHFAEERLLGVVG